jgi:ParB family transcriptional regulator, chromosome partitioning protein
MTRKALGRGLSALLSEPPKTTSSEDFIEIDLDLIEPNPSQPRLRFDETHLKELAQSITANGIVQPLLVRKLGNRYQLVAGERRWRAAQLAGIQKVPAVVRDIPDERLLELALIENIQRQELNPIEEALAYKRLIDSLGLTQEAVAQRVGRDRSFITNYLRLLRLPEDIQSMVEEEKLTTGHARALLGVDDPDIQRRVAHNVIEHGLSVRDTERAMRRVIGGTTTTVAVKPEIKRNDANIRAAETKLRRKLGTQVRVMPSAKGEGGKLEIEYYNDTDLDRIYQMLMAGE